MAEFGAEKPQVCAGLHGLPEKQTYTRQEVLEARMRHAKELHKLQEIFEERVKGINKYYQSLLSLSSG